MPGILAKNRKFNANFLKYSALFSDSQSGSLQNLGSVLPFACSRRGDCKDLTDYRQVRRFSPYILLADTGRGASKWNYGDSLPMHEIPQGDRRPAHHGGAVRKKTLRLSRAIFYSLIGSFISTIRARILLVTTVAAKATSPRTLGTFARPLCRPQFCA